MTDAFSMPPQHVSEAELVGVKALADHPRLSKLGIPKSFWMKAARDGIVPSLHIGSVTLFNPDEVHKSLVAQASKPGAFGPSRRKNGEDLGGNGAATQDEASGEPGMQ